ncbi:hypothetical protein [Spiroplasma endosymbiont of Dactylopius coccus]
MCKDCKENYNWANCQNCFKDPLPCCFSEEDMIKVENIRRKMAQKYINEYKEKLINFLKEQIQDELDKGNDGIPYIDAFELIKDLENEDIW